MKFFLRCAPLGLLLFAGQGIAQESVSSGVLTVAQGELAHGNARGALSLLSEARTQGNATTAPLLSDAAFWSTLGAAQLCAQDDLEAARLSFRHARSLGLQSLPAQPCRNPEAQALFALVLAEASSAEANSAAPPSLTRPGNDLPPRAEVREEPTVAAEVLETSEDNNVAGDSSSANATASGLVHPDVDEAVPSERPRSPSPWLEAGLVAGIGWVGQGLSADRVRPTLPNGNDAWQSCDSRGQNCEVRVSRAGAAAGLGLRIAAAFPLGDNLHLGLGLRLHNGGEGILAGTLFEGLARWKLWRRGRSHIDAGIHIGVGQIQYQPPQQELQELGIEAPYVRSGLGWAGASLTLAYDFLPGFALYGELTPRISFPEVLPVLDVGIGVRVSPGATGP